MVFEGGGHIGMASGGGKVNLCRDINSLLHHLLICDVNCAAWPFVYDVHFNCIWVFVCIFAVELRRKNAETAYDDNVIHFVSFFLRNIVEK